MGNCLIGLKVFLVNYMLGKGMKFTVVIYGLNILGMSGHDFKEKF
jgi:hypothetical protein